MILAIDPSINNLGWATYNSKIKQSWNLGTIQIPKGTSLTNVLDYIGYNLLNVIWLEETERPNKIIIEYPEFFAGSQKGATAAVQGTTFGLAAIAGFLQGYFRMQPGDVILYKPSEWKGQIPKEGMMYRFQKRFGYKAKTDHEAEAALMLDYYLNNK